MQNNSAVDAAAPTTETGSRVSLVSLQLNMATYFQRAGTVQE